MRLADPALAEIGAVGSYAGELPGESEAPRRASSTWRGGAARISRRPFRLLGFTDAAAGLAQAQVVRRAVHATDRYPNSG